MNNKRPFFSRVASWFGQRWLRLSKARVRIAWIALLEVGLIVVWAFWIGRGYLDFSQTAVPRGGEAPMVVETHYVWTLLFKCGPCMMWDGFLNGGAPAFADPMGMVLHPLTIATVLVYGVVNSEKLLVIFGLAMAGIGQWWLAKVLKLGWVARMWSAFMVVVGGHLMSKMDNGVLPLLFSIAAASLIIAPGVELALTRKRRSIILLGLMLALTWLSGQGYTQVAVIVAVLPAFAIFFFDGHFHLKPVWKDFALAGLLSVLFAGILLVPMLHFAPNFLKDGDPYLTSFPSLAYNPLSLVIADFDFFKAATLSFTPSSYHYFIYIGWVPVLLAILSLRQAPKDKNRLLAFFWLGIGLIFLVCSSEFINFIHTLTTQVEYLRYLYIASGLSIVLILGLAAWGLDMLLKVKFPRIGLFLSTEQPRSISLMWIVIGIPLVLAIKPGYDMVHLWLVDEPYHIPQEIIQAAKTSSSEWVSPPLPENAWIPALLDEGMKITGVYRPWHWDGRDEPAGYYQIVRDGDNQVTENIVEVANDLKVVRQAVNEYAYIQNGDEITPCVAFCQGGNIDVSCSSAKGGTLVVEENNWSGWSAKVDGKSTTLAMTNWLTVSAPAGAHLFTFRYRPWDVPVGILVTLAGIGLAIWIGVKKKDGPPNEGMPD